MTTVKIDDLITELQRLRDLPTSWDMPVMIQIPGLIDRKVMMVRIKNDTVIIESE